MKSFHKYFLIFIGFFFTIPAFADSKNELFLQEYVSHTWTASDGLTGNTVTDVIQHPSGYIYIGTYESLVRFDGVEFVEINKNTNSDYNFLSARSLFLDSDNTLWIGSNDEGVCCITEDGEIRNFSTADGLPNNSIRAFCQDSDGNIWVGTASGLGIITREGSIIIPENMQEISSENNLLITHLFTDTAGRIWINTDSSLYLYTNKKFSEYKNIESIKNPQITVVSQDNTGAMWFGVAPHYAVKVDGTQEKLYDLGFGNQKGSLVTCIFQDSHENIWFALDNGVTILNNGNLSYFDQSNGLADDKVAKIIEDKEKNIWLCTDRGGLQELSQSKFRTTPMPTTINAIANDEFRNCVWFAGDDGLYCMEDGDFYENAITSYCKNIRIRHVEVTTEGELLVSTYEKLGQLCFDLAGNVRKWTKENGGLPGNRTRVAIKASNGDFYIGTTSGLSIIDGQTGEVTFIQKENGVQNDYIMCIYEDAGHNIWCGTDGGGIFVLKDKKIIKEFTTNDGLAGNVIFKITSFEDNNIWICTGAGLSKLTHNGFFTFNSSNGMGTDGIFQAIPDYSGKIWCCSNKGIFSIKASDLDAVEKGLLSHVTAKYYGRSDGLASGGVTSTALSMKDKAGRIWFTLIDGYAIYDPVKSSSNTIAPIMHLQDISVDSNHYSVKNAPIIIKPFENRISIKYTGVSFISSESVQFSYKLEGFDKTFSEWSYDRNVSYTNLKPGTYRFSVKARSADEVQSPLERIIIIKKPAFWQTFWFWLFVVLIVGGTIVGFIERHINRLNKENSHIQKVFEEVTAALASTIDAKDAYTNGHSNRVAKYSKLIAARMGKTPEEQDQIYMTAVLHDIGKIGIPNAIINKPGKLTEEEYERIKTHPVIGSDILSSINSMPDIKIGARWHHERYDGNGYPDHLKGTDIPEIARIICVADSYDAMTSNRSYRKYMEQSTVRDEILVNEGTQFDPIIAEVMLSIIDEDVNYKLHE